ncbi:uncharacterized protein FA14DRAFT_128369 [Meira miltonrushii]|uniref:arginyltransferase n=1 Tax=Meira miltonrushii TaxID=1280837 RepID=A0A316V1J5_9BASI|nr:uncharacterized protein FA14DRAFT_128369 [Meira miltonrushii]PWN31342.1 hypothetical protein FA14DRAFT_128369 [Meira miltonrushii]
MNQSISVNDENDSEEGEERLSIITPIGYNTSTCGYCSEPGSGKVNRKKSSKSYGLWAHHLTPESYQSMLDRGWRRSGQYIYRPDCGKDGTCCAQLAIRLDVKSFKPNKEQRQAFNSIQNFIRSSNSRHNLYDRNDSITISNALRKGKYTRNWDVEDEWNRIEWQNDQQDHLLFRANVQKDLSERKKLLAQIDPPLPPQRKRLQVTLHHAKSSNEKYQLFRKYQAKVHKEQEDEISDQDGFERFLCHSPFLPTMKGTQQCQSPIPGEKVDMYSKSPIHFDLYHMEWRLDDRLIAVGVLDILPRCISSVYLFYDPDDSGLQLGKVSALREIALVRQIQRKEGMGSVGHYSMGLYVHSCAKMRYKAKYQPSEILDPECCKWIRFEQIAKQLDKGVRFGFSSQAGSAITEVQSGDKNEKEIFEDESEDEKEIPRPLPPGIEDPTTIPFKDLVQCAFLRGGKVYPLAVSSSTSLWLHHLLFIVINLTLVLKSFQHSITSLSRSNAIKCLDSLGALGPIRNQFCLVL